MPIRGLRDAPVGGDAEAIGHPTAHVRRQIEPDQPKLRAGGIPERGGDEATPSRAGHRALADARECALDHRDGSRFELRDAPALAPVLVSRGQMKQQVLDAADALGLEGLGAFGPNPRHRDDGSKIGRASYGIRDGRSASHRNYSVRNFRRTPATLPRSMLFSLSRWERLRHLMGLVRDLIQRASSRAT